MPLADVTREAVMSAIKEFEALGRDVFLDRYGFGPAREFWLEHGGRRYDSKAIVGAAHGHLPGYEPLAASDFSGGAETVQRVLESLGFVVVHDTEPVRRFDWTRQEVILALDLYVNEGARLGGSLPGARSEAVTALSKFLNDMDIHPRSGRGPKFRNPNSVSQKLANLRSAERDVAISRGVEGAEQLPLGNPNRNRVDLAVVEEFWDRWEALAEEAEGLRSTAAVVSTPTDRPGPFGPLKVPVEATNLTTFEASASVGGYRTRTESLLRDRYAAEMKAAGHSVGARVYRVEGEAWSLRCDVFVDDLDLLVEAKASDDRGAIRYAIGQLFDYAIRHGDRRPNMAVLTPYKPRVDLLTLLDSLNIACIWPGRTGGFHDTRGRSLSP